VGDWGGKKVGNRTMIIHLIWVQIRPKPFQLMSDVSAASRADLDNS